VTVVMKREAFSVGLQLPKRTRKVGLWALAAPALLTLSACSEKTQGEWNRVAMPEGASDRSESIIQFWQYTWLAAMIVGVLVWGLIFYVCIRFRRRSPDEIPVQTRYNLPMEILYTIAPVIVVLVFFKFVVDTLGDVNDKSEEPDHVVRVVGQQWSWTFNYVRDQALDGQTTVYEVGTPAELPTLYLPVGETVRFQLTSPDVVHSFWIPAFNYKLDVIPGRTNEFEMTPIRTGSFEGRCAELCGTYHSRMLFNVEIVSPDEYAEHLQQLQDAGNVGLAVGGQEAITQDGLENRTTEKEIQ